MNIKRSIINCILSLGLLGGCTQTSLLPAESFLVTNTSLSNSLSTGSIVSKYLKNQSKTPTKITAKNVSKGGLQTPDWAKKAVFYQIFPERFFDGNPSNNPENCQPWGAKPENFNHFGGDLDGVIQKIPYLKSLGISGIYFNPIFASDSNHKYDTKDYTKIDPHFGTLETFDKLIKTAHANGIKVILDGVFNHTGDKHFAFQDAMKNGPKSPYWNWYKVYGDTIIQSPKPNYDCWWGFGSLPQLQTGLNPQVDNHLLNDVVKYWGQRGIDGWRLDVPNEVRNPEFWVRFRNTVKSINPNAYIVGEIWEDASYWLQGDKFDSVMNYVWRKNMVQFFAENSINVDTFDQNLTNLRLAYNKEATDAMFNILSSHDTPRILNLSGGNIWKVKAAVFFQMTYVGAPVIYYGDEIGMDGAMDPDCRRTMEWNKVNDSNPVLSYYKKLIKIRNQHPALQDGFFQSVMRHNANQLLAYVRLNGNDKLICALNNSDRAQDVTVPLARIDLQSGSVQDLMTGKIYPVVNGMATVKIEGHEGAILQAVSSMKSASYIRKY